ncbi:hypothetical protein [Cytobacillus gottheilii]|uniref:Uncharacterized protein n=2 Tax=Cytobacillus gottheilii TaxID=859144 RepID=A0ABX8F877_9BACI|nr:hypothetical protein [Cytobacillus gottheilii]QVY59747.1 hypothetical protein J1899_11780 [Cytobacillus gottheilii]
MMSDPIVVKLESLRNKVFFILWKNDRKITKNGGTAFKLTIKEVKDLMRKKKMKVQQAAHDDAFTQFSYMELS